MSWGTRSQGPMNHLCGECFVSYRIVSHRIEQRSLSGVTECHSPLYLALVLVLVLFLFLSFLSPHASSWTFSFLRSFLCHPLHPSQPRFRLSLPPWPWSVVYLLLLVVLPLSPFCLSVDRPLPVLCVLPVLLPSFQPLHLPLPLSLSLPLPLPLPLPFC
ncbi:MAG: hypothetical protein BYD32DRAFT_308492 [Podila humilis]|nr:MAG: hypothetical protein BYD32DRAFT_308492 [Podila humilis]